jgi:Prokaryotic Cytochrome C oxidase subunit IV
VHAGFEKRLLVVWLALCAITILSLLIGASDGQDAHVPNAAITSSAIAIAFIKVRIIFREFMEVRHAPVLLCRLTDLWVLVTAVSLLGVYIVGMASSMG